MMIILRPAKMRDCKKLWDWINDAEVRKASFSQGPVTLDEHRRWFSARVNDPDTTMFMAFVDSVPVGVVRFERGTGKIIVSVTVDPAFRGHGYGADIIRMASKKCKEEWGGPIVAYIKKDNIISVYVFGKAGYNIDGFTKIGDDPSVIMTYP